MEDKGGQTNQPPIWIDGEWCRNHSRCTRRYFVEKVGAAGTAGGLGCVSDFFKASPGRSDIVSANQLSQLWSTELPGTVREYLIDDKRLYIATEDGSIRKLDIETGNKTELNDFSETIEPYGLAKDGQRLAVSLTNGRLLIVDAESFSKEYEIAFDGEFQGVAANKGLVCLGTTAGTQILSLEDGSPQWNFSNTVKSPVWVTSEGFALAEGAPGHSSRLMVVSAETGEQRWKTNSGTPRKPTGDWLTDDDFWGLRETESYLVFASSNAKHRLYDKYTGEQLWAETEGKDTNRPAVGPNQVFHVVGSGIGATDIKTGEQRPGIDTVAPHTNGMILYDDSLVIFGSSDDTNVMLSLDPSSRAIQWETEVDGPIGLISTIGNAILGVDLKRDEIQAYTPKDAKVNIPDGAIPMPNNGVLGGTGNSIDTETKTVPSSSIATETKTITSEGASSDGNSEGNNGAFNTRKEDGSSSYTRRFVSLVYNNPLELIGLIVSIIIAISSYMTYLQNKD